MPRIGTINALTIKPLIRIWMKLNEYEGSPTWNEGFRIPPSTIRFPGLGLEELPAKQPKRHGFFCLKTHVPILPPQTTPFHTFPRPTHVHHLHGVLHLGSGMTFWVGLQQKSDTFRQPERVYTKVVVLLDFHHVSCRDWSPDFKTLRSFHRFDLFNTRSAKLQGGANSLSVLQPLPLPRPSVISHQPTQKHDGSIIQEEIWPIFHEHMVWTGFSICYCWPCPFSFGVFWHWRHLKRRTIQRIATSPQEFFNFEGHSKPVRHPRFTPPSVASLLPCHTDKNRCFSGFFVEPNPDLKRNHDHEHTLGLGMRWEWKNTCRKM